MGPGTEAHHSHQNWELEACFCDSFSLTVTALTAGCAIWEISSSAEMPQALPFHPLVLGGSKRARAGGGGRRSSASGSRSGTVALQLLWGVKGHGWRPRKGSCPRSLYATGSDRHLEFWAGHQCQKRQKEISRVMGKQTGGGPKEWVYLLGKASRWWGGGRAH